MSRSPEGSQNGLNALSEYCTYWKLTVNTDKTKVMSFQEGGRSLKDCKWYYNNEALVTIINLHI